MAFQEKNQVGRRNFIKNISAATAILLSGNTSFLSAQEVLDVQNKVVLRFAVASDLHYGQPDTQFEEMTQKLIRQINQFHQDNNLSFCVLNGDIIHNEKAYLAIAKQKINNLQIPYFVTRGNHDMVDASYWKEVWNTPLNNDWASKDYAILLGDSSNEKGEYLSPDLIWLEKKLTQYQSKKQVFIFIHIPQIKFTNNCIDTPAFVELIKKYPNVKAVFHGHDHALDTVYMKEQVPFIFDSHAGGNWGTKYNGFRVVELLNDGTLITYMMNPTEKINLTKI
jgi:3',5'-cyclic AMP phosphodiesterase CpdA